MIRYCDILQLMSKKNNLMSHCTGKHMVFCVVSCRHTSCVYSLMSLLIDEVNSVILFKTDALFFFFFQAKGDEGLSTAVLIQYLQSICRFACFTLFIAFINQSWWTKMFLPMMVSKKNPYISVANKNMKYKISYWINAHPL